MIQTILQVADGNLGMLTRGASDIPDHLFTDQPPALPNHPAWILGHLTLVRQLMTHQFGAKPPVPENYQSLFGNGTTPTSNRAAYPSKQQLLDTLTATHHAFRNAAANATPEQLAGPHTIEPFKPIMPTLAHLLLGVLIMHDGLHLGQLTDWRRAHNLPRLMG